MIILRDTGKNIIFLLNFIIGLLLCGAEEIQLFNHSKEFKVLMIFSGNRSSEARIEVNYGGSQALDSESLSYSTDTLELNMLQSYAEEEWEKTLRMVMPNIADGKYNLIIVGSDEAAATFTKYLSEVPEKSAVIFTNVSQFDESLKRIHPNMTAIIRAQDPFPNIQLGLNLFPNTDEIVILTTGRNWSDADSMAIQGRINKKIKLTTLYFDNDSPESLQHVREVLTAVSPRSFLVSLDWDRFFVTRAASEEMWRHVRELYKNPVFLRRQATVESSIGGMMARFVTVGELTGVAAMKIFNGINAGDIPISHCPEELIVNYEGLSKYGVALSALPEGARILNVPPNWRSRNAGFLWYGGLGISALFLLLCPIMIYLYWSNRKLKLNHSVHKALPVRVFVFDRDGNVLFFHREYGVKSVLGDEQYKHVRDLPWGNTELIMESVRNVYDSGVPFVLDYDSYGEKRSVTFARIEKKIFGKVAVVSVSSDSNALQSARKEAAMAAERLALTLRSIGDAVIVTDAAERVTMINQAAEELTGYSQSESVGKSLDDIFNIVSYLDGTRVHSPVHEAIESGEVVLLANHTDLIARGGERYHIADSAAPVKNEFGEIIGAILVFRDVTEAYDRRDKLTMTMSLLRQISADSHLSVFKLNMKNGEMLPVLDNAHHFAPKDGSSIMTLRKLLIEEDCQKLEKQFLEILAGRRHGVSGIFRAKNDGIPRYIHIGANLVVNEETHDLQRELVGVFKDITMEEEQRNRLDEALLLLNKIEENIPYPIFVKDIEDNFKYTKCNKTFALHLGLSIDQVIGKTDFEIMSNPADADKSRVGDREVALSGLISESIEEYTLATGEQFKCRTTKLVISAANGKKLLLGISIDITEEEKAKKAAQENEALLMAIFDALPANIYVKDSSNDFRYLVWNKNMSEQSGFAVDTILGRNNEELGMPQEKALIARTEDNELLNTGEMISELKKYICEGGTEEFFEVYRTRVLFGERRLILGMSMNVTARLNAESKQKKEIDKLKTDLGTSLFEIELLRSLDGDCDLAQRLWVMLKILGSKICADRGYVYKIEDNIMLRVAEWSESGVGSLGRYSMNELGCWMDRLERGELVEIEDTFNPPVELELSGETLIAEMIKSLIAMPLINSDGTLYGFIGFDYVEQARSFSEEDRSLVKYSVELYKIAHEHGESRISAREMIKSADIPMALFDDQHRIIASNKLFNECTQEAGSLLPVCLCVDGNMCKLGNSSDCAESKCPVFSASINGTAHRKVKYGSREFQFYAFTVTGEKKLERCVVAALFEIIGKDANGLLEDAESSVFALSNSGVAGVFERRESELLRAQEEELSALNRRLEIFIEQDKILSACLAEIAREPDFSAALRRILEQSGPALRAEDCAIGRYEEFGEENDKPAMKMIARWMADKSARARRSKNVFHEKDFHEVFERLKTGKNIHVKIDTLALDNAESRVVKYLKDMDYKEIVQEPIIHRGKLWGFLTVERRYSDCEFNNDGMRMMEAVANIVGLLLELEARHKEVPLAESTNQRLVNAVQIPIVLLDDNLKVLEFNQASRKMLHLTTDESLKNPDICTYCPNPCDRNVEGNKCVLHMTKASGTAQSVERFVENNICLFNTLPIFDDGKIARILLYMVNVNEIAKGRELLKREVGSIMADLRKKNTLMRIAGEELRALLDSLLSGAMQFGGGEINKDVREKHALSISNYGVALQGVIELLRTLSEYDSEDRENGKNKINIAELVSLLVERCGSEVISLNIVGVMPELRGDQWRLERVLYAIVICALRESGGAGGVEMTAEYVNGVLKIIIKNSMIDVVGKFELAAIQTMVEKLGGQIYISDDVSAVRSRIIEISLETFCHNCEVISPLTQKETGEGKIKVLVVDDVAMNVKVLSAMLRKIGCEVYCAYSGKEGLELMVRMSPQLVLSDIWMPGMNGVEFANEIRRNPEYVEIRLIAVTADAESRTNFDMSCFDDVMLKPVSVEKLKLILNLINSHES